METKHIARTVRHFLNATFRYGTVQLTLDSLEIKEMHKSIQPADASAKWMLALYALHYFPGLSFHAQPFAYLLIAQSGIVVLRRAP